MQIITGRTGTNHVTSDDDRALYAGIFGTGSYVLNVGTKLEATIESSNTIRIGAGDIVHQGTHARIPYGEYEDATIDNGTTGYKRNDIIVARYKKTSGIESVELTVIKGTPSTTDAVTPDAHNGNILQGASVSDMPLYVVALDGVNIASVTSVFKICTVGLNEVCDSQDVYKKDEIYTKGQIDQKQTAVENLINETEEGVAHAQERADEAMEKAIDALETAENAVNRIQGIDTRVTSIESKCAGYESSIASLQQQIDSLRNG